MIDSIMRGRLLLFCVLLSGAAHAQGTVDKKVCIAAAERGQELREKKQMRDARGQFALCSRKECPAAVVAECTRWNAEAEAALGSVRVEATDDKGAALKAVSVVVDGSPWSDEIPDTAMFLDPGSHEIKLTHAGETIVRTVSLAMGERDRSIKVTFKAETKSTPEPAPKKDTVESPRREEGSLVPTLVLGGVAVVGFATAGTFWILGNSDLDDARARCVNGCADTEASSAKTKHLIGDIALGVGIVALAAAAYFLFTREKAPEPVVRF